MKSFKEIREDVIEFKKISYMVGKEKIIYGIEDDNVKIKYMDSYIWLIPLGITVGISLQLFGWLPDFEKAIYPILRVVFAIITIYSFLSNIIEISFRDNCLIYKNKLGKRKVFDISRYPRIYTRSGYCSTVRDHAIVGEVPDEINEKLYIEQDNIKISISLGSFPTRKLASLIYNLKLKEKEDCRNGEWDCSYSPREKTFLECINFLEKQGKIIGVKNANLKMRIKNAPMLALFYIVCISIFVFLFQAILSAGEFALWLLTLYPVAIITIMYKTYISFIRISYPSNETIKINRKIINYKKADYIITIKPYITKGFHHKYTYILFIESDTDFFEIELDYCKESEISDFINNLIFGEKQKKKVSYSQRR